MDIYHVGKRETEIKRDELELELEGLKKTQRLFAARKPGSYTKKEVEHHRKLAEKGDREQRIESRDFLQSVLDGIRIDEIRTELASLRKKSIGEELLTDEEDRGSN